MAPEQPQPSSRRTTAPWASLIVLVALFGLAFSGIWWISDMSRQNKVMATYPLVIVSALVLLLWVLRARLEPVVRRRILLSGFAVLVLALVAFRFDGFTGDLVPLFEPRWAGADARVADVGSVRVGDFPQFLGPDRDAKLDSPTLARDWQADPPEELWRRPIGEGWSGFAVLGGVAVTQEQSDEDEFVTAMDPQTGETLWSTRHDDAFTSSLGGNGPRATPTLDRGQVFATSAAGTLSALDLRSGEILWNHDFAEEKRAPVPEWGHSGSPLLVGDAVVINAGGDGSLLVAYDRDSGVELWAGGSDAAAYASPQLVRLAGVDQIVSFNAASVTAHSPLDGSVLWQHPWNRGQPNVAQPLPIGEKRLLISSGYGIGAELVEVSRTGEGEESLAVERIWKDDTLKAKFSNYLEHEGSVYGLDEGIMVCLEPATGERCWKAGRYGHGQPLLVGDLLLVQGERGEVFLVDPNPEELTELGSFQALPRKAWNTPALAGSVYLVRNHQEAAAFVLPTR